MNTGVLPPPPQQDKRGTYRNIRPHRDKNLLEVLANAAYMNCYVLLDSNGFLHAAEPGIGVSVDVYTRQPEADLACRHGRGLSMHLVTPDFIERYGKSPLAEYLKKKG